MKVSIPEHPVEGGPVVVVAKFSGGRSSALACRAALEAGVVDRLVFNNVGLESPETYEFVREVDRQWFGNRLEILELRGEYDKLHVRRPTIDDCAREGEPMKELVAWAQLPSSIKRICTSYLKVQCTFRALYEEGINYEHTKFISVIGFRADEPRRLARMRTRNEAIRKREEQGASYLKWTDEQVAPLAEAGWGKQRVLREFAEHPLKGLSFDPSDHRVRLSNCVGCFFSGRGEIERVVNEEPKYARFWSELELANYAHRGDRLKGERPGRREALAKRGLEPVNDFELNGYTTLGNNIPWSVLIRQKQVQGEFQSMEDLFAGGCGDGECGVDL